MFENLSKVNDAHNSLHTHKIVEEAYDTGKVPFGGNTGDICGGAIGRAVRTPLLDRVRRRYEVEREESHAGSIRAMQYEELLRLLEIHPDVARILDLMEALRESGGLR